MCIPITHVLSELLYHLKRLLPEGDVLEIKIWKIPKSKEFPEGIKYSLVYIHDDVRVIGYDNERGKGNHKHYYDKEEEINFKNWSELVEMFEDDVKSLRRKLYGLEG